MPCSDSSSSLSFEIDQDDKFLSFEYAKITCGREITAETGLSAHFLGWPLEKILTISFFELRKTLNISEEETQFILYMEWDALRCAVAEYLGVQDETIDRDRCRVTSIDYKETVTEVALVILPPKELPKILPCSLGDDQP